MKTLKNRVKNEDLNLNLNNFKTQLKFWIYKNAFFFSGNVWDAETVESKLKEKYEDGIKIISRAGGLKIIKLFSQ